MLLDEAVWKRICFRPLLRNTKTYRSDQLPYADQYSRLRIHRCRGSPASRRCVGLWDVLVPNAGISPGRAPIQTAELTVWWSAFKTNVKGSSVTAQAFLPHVNLQGSPTIISVNAALLFTLTFPGWVAKRAYKGSKMALAQIMQHLAQEHPSISVVSVRPGIIDTDVLTATDEQKAYMRSFGLLDTHDPNSQTDTSQYTPFPPQAYSAKRRSPQAGRGGADGEVESREGGQ